MSRENGFFGDDDYAVLPETTLIYYMSHFLSSLYIRLCVHSSNWSRDRNVNIQRFFSIISRRVHIYCYILLSSFWVRIDRLSHIPAGPVWWRLLLSSSSIPFHFLVDHSHGFIDNHDTYFKWAKQSQCRDCRKTNHCHCVTRKWIEHPPPPSSSLYYRRKSRHTLYSKSTKVLLLPGVRWPTNKLNAQRVCTSQLSP